MKTTSTILVALAIAGGASTVARADVDVPTPDAIEQAARYGGPSGLWATLEHGERVICMGCIPWVERRLYDRDATAREIAAWWLRKRPFGFGPVFERTVSVLATSADAARRRFAAEALGEFLEAEGRMPLETALLTDADPAVRAAAARALSRLNHPAAAAALSSAMDDGDADVRLAALGSATRLMGFSDTARVVALLTDADGRIRTHALGAVAELRVTAAADAIAAALLVDPEARVRAKAAYALMALGATGYVGALNDALQDPSPIVRDAVRIALRGLTR